MPLLLFDIDGTLLYTGGAGLKAFKRACDEVLNADIKLTKHHFAGKLDCLIFKGVFEAHAGPGRAWADSWPGFREKYLNYLSREAADPASWKVYPGVRACLDAQEKRAFLGLLTGNMVAGARIKLSAVGLWDHFQCGAFGDSGEDRGSLARRALAACRESFGRDFSEVWVIGDTVSDIRCGKSIGAKTLGVRTGFAKPGELESAGADRVVDTLEEFV